MFKSFKMPTDLLSKKGSIRRQITVTGAIPVIIGFLVILALVLSSIYSMLNTRIEREIGESTIVVADNVDRYFEKFDHITDTMAGNEQFVNIVKEYKPGGIELKELPEFEESFQSLVNIQNSDENIVCAWIGDFDTERIWVSDGFFSGDDWDMHSREWYKKIQENPDASFIMSKPFLYEYINQYVVSVVTPIRGDNKELIGVAAVDITIAKISEFMATQELGETGFFVLVADSGEVMYHPNSEFLNLHFERAPISQNLIEKLQKDEVGNVDFKEGSTALKGYIDVAETTKWKVVSGIQEKEVFGDFFALRSRMILIFVIVICVYLFVLQSTSKKISASLIELNGVASKIADGDLDVRLDIRSNNEVGMVADSMRRTVDRLKEYIEYINEIAQVLSQMADGDMRIRLTKEYIGEFGVIKSAFSDIGRSLNQTLHMINNSAEQVNQSAVHVSSSAQSLASGAAEQASSLEELSSFAATIATQSKESAEIAGQARDLAIQASGELGASKLHMDKMLVAMEDITKSSEEIHKIIKVIDDIAFQTNILALNASVEAARAGEAGKGFAVVADEVRNLAVKSAEAAKQTQLLVEESVRNANIGLDISKDTSRSLDLVGEKAQQSTHLISVISDSSKEQAATIEQINTSLEQVSRVVQSNAATSEQSSAASEELSAQAKMLYDEVKRFKLEDERHSYEDFTAQPSRAARVGSPKSGASVSSPNLSDDKY